MQYPSLFPFYHEYVLKCLTLVHDQSQGVTGEGNTARLEKYTTSYKVCDTSPIQCVDDIDVRIPRFLLRK